jgi:hypothetical protein
MQLNGPATSYLDTGFSWLSCLQVYLHAEIVPKLQDVTISLSCSPPDLNIKNYLIATEVTKFVIPNYLSEKQNSTVCLNLLLLTTLTTSLMY